LVNESFEFLKYKLQKCYQVLHCGKEINYFVINSGTSSECSFFSFFFCSMNLLVYKINNTKSYKDLHWWQILKKLIILLSIRGHLASQVLLLASNAKQNSCDRCMILIGKFNFQENA
jgi:hypothetical protein